MQAHASCVTESNRSRQWLRRDSNPLPSCARPPRPSSHQSLRTPHSVRRVTGGVAESNRRRVNAEMLDPQARNRGAGADAPFPCRGSPGRSCASSKERPSRCQRRRFLVAFADEPDLLDATRRLKGVTKRNPLAAILECLARVGVAEGGGNIPAAEQHLPAGGDGSSRRRRGRTPRRRCRSTRGRRGS